MRSQLDFFRAKCIITGLVSVMLARGRCMFGFGMPELVVILVIVLVVFGAGKLPEIGGALGKSIRNFKRASDGKDEIVIKPGKDNDEKKV